MRIRKVNKDEFEYIEEFVYEIFKNTDYTDGILERKLVREIRESQYYIPELDLLAEEDGKILGHFIMSKFPISNQYQEEMLLLSPVSVAIKRQRQGLGKQMLRGGIEQAKKMGYKGIIVEGDPAFYNQLGFVTSTKFGIKASEKNIPPSEDCLMAMELYEDGLKNISGEVDFSIYNSLT
jgi:predicted N-acetyltransferase YhbS